MNGTFGLLEVRGGMNWTFGFDGSYLLTADYTKSDGVAVVTTAPEVWLDLDSCKDTNSSRCLVWRIITLITLITRITQTGA